MAFGRASAAPTSQPSAQSLTLHQLVKGYGYEITDADVRAAFSISMKAAEKNGVIVRPSKGWKRSPPSEGPGGGVARIIGAGPWAVMSEPTP
jgi:hypothetical protein